MHSTHSESSASVKSARTIPGMGGHLLKRKERRVPGDDNSNSIPTVGDFNIEQALTGFDKEKEFEKLTVDEAQVSKLYIQKPIEYVRQCTSTCRDRIRSRHSLTPFRVTHWTDWKGTEDVFLQATNGD